MSLCIYIGIDRIDTARSHAALLFHIDESVRHLVEVNSFRQIVVTSHGKSHQLAHLECLECAFDLQELKQAELPERSVDVQKALSRRFIILPDTADNHIKCRLLELFSRNLLVSVVQNFFSVYRQLSLQDTKTAPYFVF